MSPHQSGQAGLALPPLKCNELIEYVLQYHEAPTTIVVCSSRELFLESLPLSLLADNSSEDAADNTLVDGSLHPLLVPTIHQLATSRTIDLAFAPTLPHLRAYLASYGPSRASTPPSTAFAKPGSHNPMLAMYGLLKLHHATTEYSVQGLSRSLAIAAEAADTWGMRLILVEPSGGLESLAAELALDGETNAAPGPWAEQVPLLNSSLALSNDRVWGGRTVAVGAIIAKWCKIARP